MSTGVTPGGPAVSSAKKRRLAALEDNFRGKSTPGRGQQPPSTTTGTIAKRLRNEDKSTSRAGVSGFTPPTTGDGAPAENTFPYNRLESSRQVTPGSIPWSSISDLLVDLMEQRGQVGDARSALMQRLTDKSIMLDNPRKQLTAEVIFQRTAQKRYTQKLLPQKVRKKLTQVSSASIRYSLLQPLHELWQQYFSRVVRDLSAPNISEILANADYHGALLEVVQCKDPRYVGVKGLVAQVTSRTMVVVDQQDRVHGVPRLLSRFHLHHQGQHITFYGKALGHVSPPESPWWS